jgi:predicted GTPase
LAQELRCAIGPLPATSRAAEYLLKPEGHSTAIIVDMRGLDERTEPASELRVGAERADIIMWVASATQPARSPDRRQLDDIRAWAKAQPARRLPPVLLALTHIDELRPAAEWTPPYDVTAPTGPKARAIRAAVNAAANALDLPVDTIVPVAMPPGRESYNLDVLWGRIAVELGETKLVQLDRFRVGRQRLRLRELVHQLGHAGRTIVKGIAKVGKPG